MSRTQVTAQVFDDIKQQLAASMQQYSILQEQLRRLEHDNKRVKDQLDAEKQNTEVLTSKNQKLLKDIQTADGEVRQYLEQRDIMMLEISSHKTTIFTYDGRFTDMQRQINMLHGALQAERKDNDEMRKLLQDSRAHALKISNASFTTHSNDIDDKKEREVIASLHLRLAEKDDECLKLQKLLLQAQAQETCSRTPTVDPDTAASTTTCLQSEIIDARKIAASVQAENEILMLQLQSAQAQLRQREELNGRSFSSTLFADVVHTRSNGPASSNETAAATDAARANVQSQLPASGSRSSSDSIADGMSDIGSFFGAFATRVQSSVVQAASSVSSISQPNSSSVFHSSSTVTSHTSSQSLSVVKQTVTSSGHQLAEPMPPALIVHVPDHLSSSAAEKNAAPGAPAVAGTGLFISSTKSQDSPVRYHYLLRGLNVRC
jgi:hypothetical protein